MSQTRIFVELEIEYPEEEHYSEFMLMCLRAVFGQECPDLNCQIERIDPTPILPDLPRTLRLAYLKARELVCTRNCPTVMYIATRNIVIPLRGQQFDVCAYVIVAANERGLFGATIVSRSGPLPNEALSWLESEMVGAQVSIPQSRITDEERKLAERLTGTFTRSLDVIEQPQGTA